jgi:REP element-mobilizing transposase RayT
MDKYDSLSHSKWECKYHVVFIPKCRRKTLYYYCVISSNARVARLRRDSTNIVASV